MKFSGMRFGRGKMGLGRVAPASVTPARGRPGKIASLALTLAFVAVVCVVPQVLAKKKDPAADSSVNEQKRALHALNRLTFGPRPGDIQQVTAMGVDRWIDEQLHPEKISDSAVESRLTPFRTLHMSPKELNEEFPENGMIKQIMEGKRQMPSDPVRRAIIEVQIARFQEKKAKKAEAVPAVASASAAAAQAAAADGAKTPEELAAAAAATAEPADGDSMKAMSGSSSGDGMSAPAGDPSMAPKAEEKAEGKAEEKTEAKSDFKVAPMDDVQARRREDRLYADLKVQGMGIADLPPEERYKKVMAMSTEDRLAFADSLRGAGEHLLDGMEPRQKETLMAMNNPQSVVLSELVQAKLLRAIYSDRQLEQVMTDFWFNHFNVFVGKGPEREFLTNYEQQVIRPRALGKFEDLLLATAKSPAMLFYLDNWMSVGPNSEQAAGPRHPGRYGPYGRYGPTAKRKQPTGLNENYGRELLELHTLSVNGGYSQRDVTEVAKVFTGWTIEKPYEGLGFRYDARMHEPGPKFVLGHKIKPHGEDEGREVLHLLATSPQTAHFISLKLAERFVSDDPPPALVDRMAKTFQKKKGDIREVLITLFHSPEFWSDSAYRAKVKTPLEFVASAVRATGANVDDAFPLSRQISNMGMPLYSAQPPTGYSMKAETWVSSSALLGRMNFALGLTNGKVRGVKVDAVQLAGGPPAPADASAALSTLEAKLLAGDVSKQTHDSIIAQIQGPSKNDGVALGVGGGMQDSRPGDPRPGDSMAHDGMRVPPRKGTDMRGPDASTMAGLLLGSPEFQKR